MTFFKPITCVIVCAVVALVSPALWATHVGVPHLPVGDYQQDVEVWWANHPYNPDGVALDNTFSAPAGGQTINLSNGDNLANAINSLDSSLGGRIELQNGTYDGGVDIVARDNVQIVGLGSSVTLSMSKISYVMTCESMRDYGYYDSLLDGGDPAAWQCLINPRGGILFENVVIDGGGSRAYSHILKRVQDVVFKNATFQNMFMVTPLHHRGVVCGHMGLDGIWFLNCDFLSAEEKTTYLDGAHGSGMVNCYVDLDNFQSGFLFLCNDDFSEDYNGNGVLDDNEEKRIANYIAIYGCTFDGGGIAGTELTGAHLLSKNNVVTGGVNNFVHVSSREISDIDGETNYYTCYGTKVIGNTVPNCYINFTRFENITPNPGQMQPLMGQYEVRGNTVDNIRDGVFIATSGPIDGPNVVCGNCIEGGGTCPANPNCGQCSEAPDAPTGLAADAVTHEVVELSWTASGGCPATSYTIFRDGGSVGTVGGTAYTDSTVASSTVYSYMVRGSNSYGESGDSNTVVATTDAPPPPPAMPTGLTLDAVEANGVALSWDTAADATGYIVYRDGGSIGTTTATATAYTDTTMACCVSYTYTVSSTNATGESTPSDPVVADVPAAMQDADLSNNGTVDVADVAVMAGNWLSDICGSDGDLDASGVVDLGDLSILAAQWGQEDINNLLINGDFEDGMTSWNGPYGGSSSLDTTVGRNGSTASFKVVGATSAGYLAQDVSGTLLSGSTNYTLSAWLKLDNVTADVGKNGVRIRFVEWDGQGGQQLHESVWLAGTSDWQLLARSFTSQSVISDSRLDLQWDHTGGDAWYDDVMLVED